MSDITLINLFFGGGSHLPRGALQLASVLEVAGFKVDFRDYSLVEEDYANPEKISEFISKKSAEVIGISCMSNTLPYVVKALKILKNHYPDKKVVLGGPGPTPVAKDLIAAFPFIDIVVLGEAENSFPVLIKTLKEGKPISNVKGIVFSEKGKIVQTPRPPRIDLNALPLPAYHLADVKRYPGLGIELSRGCPYHCSFCGLTSLWGHQVYRRANEAVLDEMEFLHQKYGRKKFVFYDNNFVLNRKETERFCEGFKQRKFDFEWGCYGRFDLMDSSLMKQLKSANCTAILYGLESGSDKVLQEIRKSFTVEQAKKIVLKSKNIFDSVECSFIYGFPFETMGDFYETTLLYLLMLRNNVKAQYYLLSPMIGSEIYEVYKNKLFLDEKIWSSRFVPTGPLQSSSEIISLIKKYPHIFASFYCFETEQFEKKHQTIKNLNQFLRHT